MFTPEEERKKIEQVVAKARTYGISVDNVSVKEDPKRGGIVYSFQYGLDTITVISKVRARDRCFVLLACHRVRVCRI